VPNKSNISERDEGSSDDDDDDDDDVQLRKDLAKFKQPRVVPNSRCVFEDKEEQQQRVGGLLRTFHRMPLVGTSGVAYNCQILADVCFLQS
jgi:hypothetical protein